MEGPIIRIGKKLGNGAFSNVFRAEMTHPGQPTQHVAMKRYTTEYSPGVSTSQLLDVARREYDVAKDLNHPNVIKLLAFMPAHSSIMMAQELAVGGDLFDRLTPGYGITADAGADIMCGILNGLTYLHETANMVHLDLKPENILLGEGDAPKLADFDAALPLFCETDVVRGTRDVHPPELVANEPLYKMILASADIWSVGVLAHVLVTGTHPWGAAELNDPKFEDFCSYGVAGGDDRVTTPTKQSPTDPHSPLWCRLPPDLANAFGLMLSLEPQNRGNAGFVHDMVRQCWKTDVDEVRETAATAGKNAENQRPARELKYQWSRSPIRRKKFFSPGSQKKAATNADPHLDIADATVAVARVQSGLSLYQKACQVCLEDFDVPTRKCRELPCGHMFHTSCIDSYLKKRTTCPVCSDSEREVSMVKAKVACYDPARSPQIADARGRLKSRSAPAIAFQAKGGDRLTSLSPRPLTTDARGGRMSRSASAIGFRAKGVTRLTSLIPLTADGRGGLLSRSASAIGFRAKGITRLTWPPPLTTDARGSLKSRSASAIGFRAKGSVRLTWLPPLTTDARGGLTSRSASTISFRAKGGDRLASLV